MNPEKVNSFFTILLSLIPFVAVGGFLFYKTTKPKRSIFKKTENISRPIRVGDKNYIVKKSTRILVNEKKTGREAIVTTCGYEDEQQQLEGELINLPEGIKVCYRLENGIFSPEESDWLAGDDFNFIEVAQVEEYKEHNA